MLTVIFLAQRASFGVGALACFGFGSVCGSGSVVGLRFSKVVFCAAAAAA